VTPPEPPVEIPRPLFTRRADPSGAIAAAGDDPHFHPRYVQLHALREYGHGRRNLAGGVVTLVLALGLLGLALFLAGPRALLALGVCLATCVALFVLARLHVFRQRNGGFFALGLVCLLGAAMPLIQVGYTSLAGFANSRPAPNLAQVTAQATEMQPLLLNEAFALSAPDPKAGTRVKVLKDSRVIIEGKPFLIKAGDLFPLGSKTGGEVTLVVRDLLVALPAEATEILSEKPAPQTATTAGAPVTAKPKAPAAPGAPIAAGPETPDQVTARAQREAIRRYPALGVKDSLENQMFISTYREIRDAGGDDFFTNPQWPIELAELLAKRERWTRGAGPLTVSSGPAAAAAEEAQAEDAAAKAADTEARELLPDTAEPPASSEPAPPQP
jgi:hypothetical protein